MSDRDRLPVVAAIANYNMADELERLLPQVTEQGYDKVFVLDDASTDYSRDVVNDLSDEVVFVAGEKNKGAGANRNRIMPALGHEAIIHFLDADTDLQTERMAEVVREVVPSGLFGFVGGLVTTKTTGMQSVWNYGPRQCLAADIGANIQARIEPLLASDPERTARLRNRFSKLLADWPDPLAEPVRRQVFWNVESNLVVRSAVFDFVGGFDENLREHEIQDLAIRMRINGLDKFFDPLLSVRHTEAQVRDYNRARAMATTEFRIARKHGFWNWFRPDGHFRPSL